MHVPIGILAAPYAMIAVMEVKKPGEYSSREAATPLVLSIGAACRINRLESMRTDFSSGVYPGENVGRCRAESQLI